MTTTDGPEALTSDERTFGAIAHVSTFSGHLIPLGHILGPLIVWLVKRDDSEFVAEHAKQALNFQITMTVLAIVAVGAIILTLGLGALVLIPVGIIVWLLDIVFTIIGALRAYDGRPFNYPLSLPWV